MEEEILQKLFAQKANVKHGKASMDLTHYKDIPSGECPYCHEPVDSNPPNIKAINLSFHPHCLICIYCQTEINPADLQEKDDMIFHKNCYNEAFEERCARCGEFVQSDVVVHAISRAYHPNCFVCAHCGDPQVKDRYMNLYAFPYCMKCFQQFKNTLPECYTCKQSILPNDKRETIIYKGKKYFFHPLCIQCEQCAATPANRRLIMFNNKVYCIKCLGLIQKKICAGCNKTIEGECCQVEGIKYHPEEFKCSDCGTPLQNGVAVLDHGKLRCRKCSELYIKQCRGCTNTKDEPTIIACGAKWHRDCFKCMKCSKNLADSKYVNMNGYPCCESCYRKMLDNNEIDRWRRPIEN
ncbi:LIM domain containing protein [Trichomonas vaginalis G3]|uniref:LIM domain containing protein n=1 Tax=Trichomonas vaginalis (strain ATCC PRA-98 / G3) TaxID=412133 RepID=A2EAF1_TRIV3|nr:uncharacterized protein TVAGG3_0924100 [Trichomonas vaginalis G3]EAY10378.1 LIM domain containing protein [Trichomonas vaginalis G3]KAI5485332.1 actinin binding [Trichomonas vaginalis G3]|eukprot:XP_001322601.1 hypothetical protein [Trichomonas vaginalis G3]